MIFFRDAATKYSFFNVSSPPEHKNEQLKKKTRILFIDRLRNLRNLD